MKLQEQYRTREVVKLANVSERQLQWWDERNILKPVRFESHCRFYSHRQLETIKAVSALRTVGLSPHRATKILARKVRDINRLVEAIRTVQTAGLKVQ